MVLVRLSCITSVFIILISSVVSIHGALTPPRVAVAQLGTHGNLGSRNITGIVFFTETENGLRVQGSITGLEPGLYGFHVHELGNVITCDATGPHFDPHGRPHGGRDHEIRHVGDLGNVEFRSANGLAAVATFDFEDSLIAFSGRNNILGRSLVLHEREDDLGLTDHEQSSISGNAGARVACGVIGIAQGDWNSGFTKYSSSTLIIFGVMFLYLK